MEELRAWWEVPSIAHFCSLFAAAFDLTEFHIDELEEGLLASDTEDGSFIVTDLMCQLLGGCYQRSDITPYNWELYLRDIIKHRWQVETGLPNPVENTSFAELPLRTKVEIIHALCNYRLDADDVTDVLRGLDGDPLRVEPLGKDKGGATYWYFYGTRLYREDPEPTSESESEQQSEEEETEKEELPPKQKGKGKRKKERDKRTESRGRGQRGRRGRGRGGRRGGRAPRKQESESEEQSSEEEKQRKRGVPSSESNDSDSDALINHVRRGGASRRRGRGRRGTRGRGRGRGGKAQRRAKSKKISSESSEDEDENKNSNSDSEDELPVKKRPTRRSDKKVVKKKQEEDDEDTEDYGDKSSKDEDDSSEDLPLKDLNDKLKHEKLNNAIKEEENKDTKENLPLKSKDLDSDTKLVVETKVEKGENEEDKMDVGQERECANNNIKSESKSENGDSPKNSESLSTTPNGYSKTEIKTESTIKAEKDIKTEVKVENHTDCGSPKQEETNNTDSKEGTLKTDDNSDSAPPPEKELQDNTSDTKRPSKTDEASDTEMKRKSVSSSSDDEVLSVVKKRVHEQNSETPKTVEMVRPAFVLPSDTRWHVQCNTMDDWKDFAERFEKSRIKNEKLLFKALRDDFLPDLPDIYDQQEKDRERRIEEMAPRRASGRIHKMKAEEEQLILESLEHDRKHKRERQAEEADMRRRMDEMEQEEIDKQRQIEKERAAAERARRAKLREERAQMLAEGREIPPELLNGRIISRKPSSGAKSPVRITEDIEASMYKVFDAIYEHPDSWPFHEPVDESYAPGYLEIIEHPMDMATIERKLNDKAYANREEFIEDFTLMFDNCHAYNGADSEYTKMAGVLEKKFQKAVKRHLPQKEVDSDASDIEFSAKMAREASFNINTTPRSRQSSRAASSRAKAAIQVATEEMKLSNTETSEEDVGSLSSASNQDGSLMKRVRKMKSASNSPQPQKSMLAKAPQPVAYNNGEVCITRVRNPGPGNQPYPSGQGTMGPHGQMRPQMMGHPNPMMSQQGYMNQQRPPGYMGQQYPGPQGQYPQGQQGQFPRQQGHYQGQGPYSNPQGGPPPQRGPYPDPRGQGFPNQPGPYPGQQGNYQGPMPGQYMGPQGQYGQYPGQMGQYPNQMGPQNRPTGPRPGAPQQYMNGQTSQGQQLGPDGRPVETGEANIGPPQQYPAGLDGGPRMQMGPQRPQMGPQGSQMGQQGSQIGPQASQIGPQGPQMEQRPQMGPQGTQMGPQGHQMGPQGPQMGPRGPQMGPQGPQVGPQGPQMGPHGPQGPHMGSQARPMVQGQMPQGPHPGVGRPEAGLEAYPRGPVPMQMGPNGRPMYPGQIGPHGHQQYPGDPRGPNGQMGPQQYPMGLGGMVAAQGQQLRPRGPGDAPGHQMGPRGPNSAVGHQMGPRGPIPPPGQPMGQGNYRLQGPEGTYPAMSHPQQWGSQGDIRPGMPLDPRSQDSRMGQQLEGKEKEQHPTERTQPQEEIGPQGPSQEQKAQFRPQGPGGPYPQHRYGPPSNYTMQQGPRMQPGMQPGMNMMGPRHPMVQNSMPGHPSAQYRPQFGNIPPSNSQFPMSQGPEGLPGDALNKEPNANTGQNAPDVASQAESDRGVVENQSDVHPSPVKNNDSKTSNSQNTEILPHLYTSNQPGSFRQSFWRAKTTVTTVKPGLQLAVPALGPTSKPNSDDENSREESVEEAPKENSEYKDANADSKESGEGSDKETADGETKTSTEPLFDSSLPQIGNKESCAPTAVTMTRLSQGQIPSGYPDGYRQPPRQYPPGQYPPGEYGGREQGPYSAGQILQDHRPRMPFPGMHPGMPQMMARPQQHGLQARPPFDHYQRPYIRPPSAPRPEMQGISSHPFLGALSRMEPNSQFEPKGPNDTYVPKLDDLQKYDPVPVKKTKKGKKKLNEEEERLLGDDHESDQEKDGDADSTKCEKEDVQPLPETGSKGTKTKREMQIEGDKANLREVSSPSNPEVPQLNKPPGFQSKIPEGPKPPQVPSGESELPSQARLGQGPYGPNMQGQGPHQPGAFGQHLHPHSQRMQEAGQLMPTPPHEMYGQGTQGIRQPNPESFRHMQQGQQKQGQPGGGPYGSVHPASGQGLPGSQQGLSTFRPGQPAPGFQGQPQAGSQMAGPFRHPVKGPHGMEPQMQPQGQPGPYGHQGQPFQQQGFRHPPGGHRMAYPEGMQRPQGPTGHAPRPEGPQYGYTSQYGPHYPTPQNSFMRPPGPGPQQSVNPSQINDLDAQKNKDKKQGNNVHGELEDLQKPTEPPAVLEPNTGISDISNDEEEHSQDEGDNQKESVEKKDEKYGSLLDTTTEDGDKEVKKYDKEENAPTSIEHKEGDGGKSDDEKQEKSLGNEGSVKKEKETDTNGDSDKKRIQEERSKDSSSVDRISDGPAEEKSQSVPVPRPQMDQQQMHSWPRHSMPPYGGHMANPGQPVANMPLASQNPNYLMGNQLPSNGPVAPGSMHPQRHQQLGYGQRAPSPGVGMEGLAPGYNMARPPHNINRPPLGGLQSMPAHMHQRPTTQHEQVPSPQGLGRQRHSSQPEAGFEKELRTLDNKELPLQKELPTQVGGVTRGPSREPSPQMFLGGKAFQNEITGGRTVPSPSNTLPQAKKRKQESPDPIKAKIWRPGVEENSVKLIENQPVSNTGPVSVHEHLEASRENVNINGTPENQSDSSKVRPFTNNMGIANDVPVISGPGQPTEMAALSPASHTSSSTSYLSSLQPTKESVQTNSPSPPSSPKQFLDLDQQRPAFSSSSSYSSMPRSSLSVMPGYNSHMSTQPPSGNLLDLDRYRARLPNPGSVHRPRPDSPQQRYLEMEMARSEMARSEMARSEMARSEIARSEMARSEMARSEMARSEMARSEMARSEMARSEMARSEMARSEMARSEMARSGHMMAGYAQSHMMKHPGQGMNQSGMMSHYPGGGYSHPSLGPRPTMQRDPAMMMTNPQAQLQLQHEQQMRHEAQIRQEQQREQQMRHEHMLRQQMMQQRQQQQQQQHPSMRPPAAYGAAEVLTASKMLTGLVAAHQNQSPFSQQPQMANGAGNMGYPNGAANMPYGVPRGPFQ